MRLHAGSVPDGAHPWRAMFNTDAFYALRGEPCWHEILRDDAGNVLGDLTYHATERLSGWSAPFGGPDWRRDYWAPELIRPALERLIRSGGVLGIRCKPESYGENEALTTQALLSDGWRVEAAELNYAIRVPGTIDEYEAQLSRQARAAIDKGDQLGLEVVEIGPENDLIWLRAYQLLRDNREAKGRALSLTFEYVLAIRDAFPGLVRLLGALRISSGGEEQMVAAALVYRVGAARDVVQWWGDDPHAKLPASPMNLLVREVVQHAISTGARVLDLGISTEGGRPNGGLCRFKRSVGATAEPRYVLGL